MIFGSEIDLEEHVKLSELPDVIRLQRQVSYFGNQEGFEGLMAHLGDDGTGRTVLRMIWEDRGEAYNSYKRFGEWSEV